MISAYPQCGKRKSEYSLFCCSSSYDVYVQYVFCACVRVFVCGLALQIDAHYFKPPWRPNLLSLERQRHRVATIHVVVTLCCRRSLNGFLCVKNSPLATLGYVLFIPKALTSSVVSHGLSNTKEEECVCK